MNPAEADDRGLCKGLNRSTDWRNSEEGQVCAQSMVKQYLLRGRYRM